MKKHEVEKKISTAVENVTPNKLDSIMSACTTQQGKIKIETIAKKKSVWGNVLKGTSVVAAVLILVFCLSLVLPLNTPKAPNTVTPTATESSVETVILFDVNPSFSIAVDADEKIVFIEAANEDAAEVMGDANYKGKTLDEAVDGIVEGMVEKGYLSELQNSVLVSVDDKNSDRGEKVRQKVAERVDECMKNRKLDGAVLSQPVDCEKKEYKDLAKEKDISVGKVVLIQKLISKDATLSFDDLSKLSVNQLALLLNSNQLGTEEIKQKGKASDKAYITKEAALEAALEKAGFAKEDVKEIEIEFKCKKGNLVYEVEFKVDLIEYEYKIDATTGEILKEEIETEDEDEDKDDDFGKNDKNDKDDDKEKPVIDTSTFIGEAEAQKIALKDLDIEESAAAFVETKIEKEDGVPEYYKVKIYLNDVKHVYKIDLTQGTILAHKENVLEKEDDKQEGNENHGGKGEHPDIPGNSGNGNHGENGGKGENGGMQAGNAIGKEKALEIVFADAGVAETDVTGIKVGYDHNRGKSEYEIKFKYNDTKYEYEVNAVTGEIIEKEINA